METPEVKTKVYDPPNRGPRIDIKESKKTDPPTRYVQDSVKIHQPKFHVFIQDSGPICCICVFVFARLTHGNIILNIFEKNSCKIYATYWVFLAIRDMLYLCILYLYIFLVGRACGIVGRVHRHTDRQLQTVFQIFRHEVELFTRIVGMTYMGWSWYEGGLKGHCSHSAPTLQR